MICNMRVNAAVLTVYRDIFAGGEKKIFDHLKCVEARNVT